MVKIYGLKSLILWAPLYEFMALFQAFESNKPLPEESGLSPFLLFLS